jgi:hypothetical protein
MNNDFQLIINKMNIRADAAQVLTKVREVYAQMEIVHNMVDRFSSDQAFSDAFDDIMFSGGFDGTFAISQMFYEINTLRTQWLANQDKKDVLGIP